MLYSFTLCRYLIFNPAAAGGKISFWTLLWPLLFFLSLVFSSALTNTMKMASYKRLSPEDVYLSCPVSAKQPSVVPEQFPVSPYGSVGLMKLENIALSLRVNSMHSWIKILIILSWFWAKCLVFQFSTSKNIYDLLTRAQKEFYLKALK